MNVEQNSDESSVRLFIGIPVPVEEPLIRFTGELKRAFNKSKIRWVPDKNYHVTVHFLGDISPGIVPDISPVMEQSLGEIHAFSCRLRGVGVFRNIRNPKVLWLGVVPENQFREIYTQLNTVYKLIGLPAPVQRYSPHLTIGRIRKLHDRELLEYWIEKYDDFSISSFRVDRVDLYRSKLKNEGPEYHIINSFRLND